MAGQRDRALGDVALLAGRILLVLPFPIYGWDKLFAQAATVEYFRQLGAPLPGLAVMVALLVELPVALAIACGAWTRALVLVLAVYTLGTALIGHPFWAATGAARAGDAINFYKNIAIIGGCLLLWAAGPGRHSIDAARGREPFSR